MRRALSFIVLALGILTTAAPAEAFCRKTTSGADDLPVGADARECTAGSGALPLYWAESCVGLRVIVDPELEGRGTMTRPRATSIVDRAISTWTTARCTEPGGGSVPLAIDLTNTALNPCPGRRPGVRNEIRFAAEAAPAHGLLAATELTFDAMTGVIRIARTTIFDVHAELAAPGVEDVDARVEGVVRHELGHFLGLAHSQAEGAIMHAGYEPTSRGGLTDDDLGGICDAYSSARPIGAGCSMSPSPVPPGGSCSTLLMVAALLVARRARPKRLAALLAAALSLFGLAPTASAAPQHATRRELAHDRRPTRQRPMPKPVPGSAPKHRTQLTAAEPESRGVDDTELVLRPGPLETHRAEDAPAHAAVPDTPARAPREPTSSDADYFVGARYRAFLLPKTFVAAFATSNTDPLFHSAALELDVRKERFSIVPALTFADLSTGDMLVGENGSDLASSFSYIRSNLKALAASIGLVWSTPITRSLSLELGVELGVGVSFGALVNTWVYETPSGPLAYGGRRFAPCRTVDDGFGCRPQDHGSPTPVRVGGYREPSVLSGGLSPTILPWVSLPLLGGRVRLGDDVAARLGVGASITGLWLGFSLDYAVANASSRSPP